MLASEPLALQALRSALDGFGNPEKLPAAEAVIASGDDLRRILIVRRKALRMMQLMVDDVTSTFGRGMEPRGEGRGIKGPREPGGHLADERYPNILLDGGAPRWPM